MKQAKVTSNRLPSQPDRCYAAGVVCQSWLDITTLYIFIYLHICLKIKPCFFLHISNIRKVTERSSTNNHCYKKKINRYMLPPKMNRTKKTSKDSFFSNVTYHNIAFLNSNNLYYFLLHWIKYIINKVYTWEEPEPLYLLKGSGPSM